MKGLYPSKVHSAKLGFDEEVYDSYLHEIQDYQAVPAHTEITYDMPHWNALYMKVDTSCVEIMEKFAPDQKPIEWFDINIGKTDLRKILVYCDHGDLKWKTRV